MTSRQIVWIAIGIVTLWLAFTAGIYAIGGSWPERGTIGDSFGAVNALFSGLAFGGVIIAIVLQGQELKSQRVEFRHQAFESAFFQLLRLHVDILQSLSVQLNPNGEVYRARQAFTMALGEVEGMYSDAVSDDAPHDKRLRAANVLYLSVCHSPTADFGHYFRNLYHIVKFIHETPIELEGLSEDSAKRRYTGFVRAQLSQDELGLLFYGGLRDDGGSKFKPLIERYSLLHELRLSPKMDKLANHYEVGAFGEGNP